MRSQPQAKSTSSNSSTEPTELLRRRYQQKTPAAPIAATDQIPAASLNFSRVPLYASSDSVVQAKLTVGSPNDKYEQEADRVAEQVMRMPAPSETAGAVRWSKTGPQGPSQLPTIQRKCTKCEEEQKLQAKEISGTTPEVAPQVAARVQSLQGVGQPLPASARQFFEPRFGRDFSQVRIHTDAASTQALGARAYTLGRNIVFNTGQYAPETTSGRQLLAHELTHVSQQQPTAILPQRTGERPHSRGSFAVSSPATMATEPAAILQHATAPIISRYSERRTVTTADYEVMVDRIVRPGQCRRRAETRSSSSSRLEPGGRAVFEASACRGSTAGSVRGELDFSELISSFGSFISGLPAATSSSDPSRSLEELARTTVGGSTTRGNVRFTLQLRNFRLELGGGAGGSPARSTEGQISGLLRYADGQFRIELQGSYEALRAALAGSQDAATLRLGTDFGPVEIRLRGRYTGSQSDAGTSEVLGFTGSVGYRLGSEALQVGVDVERTLPPTGLPNTQVLFTFGLTTGERIPAGSSSDCYTCRCSEPQIEYQCWQRDRTSDTPGSGSPPTPQPLTVPLFFEYADTVPRIGAEQAYQDALHLIVSRLREGYTIRRIEGNASPEGPLARHPSGRFEGNQRLAEDRALEAQRDLRAAVIAALGLTIRTETRQRLQTALTATYPVEGRAELFGENTVGREVSNRDLPAHLIGTLQAPAAGQPDPLEQAHVIGSDIPDSILGNVRTEVDAFRSGMSRTRSLSRDERAQALYRVLRRAVIFLDPPQPQSRGSFSITLAPEQINRVIGTSVPCEDTHRQAFRGVSIPPEELFEDHCSDR